MITFLLEILGTLAIGRSFPRAFEAVASNANSQRAARLRLIAVVCLFVSAAFLVVAAILWRPIQRSPLIDVLGWTGVVIFEAFLIVGNRCHREQQSAG